MIRKDDIGAGIASEFRIKYRRLKERYGHLEDDLELISWAALEICSELRKVGHSYYLLTRVKGDRVQVTVGHERDGRIEYPDYETEYAIQGL